MAKYCGIIGFMNTSNSDENSDTWVDTPVKKKYYGDIIKNYKRNEQGSGVNDNITINNQISILADPYARENFHNMLFAEFMDSFWKIQSVEVQYPRLIISLGGLYNGRTE